MIKEREKEDFLKRSCALLIMVLVLVFGCSKAQEESGADDGAISDPHVVARIGNDMVYDRDIEMVLSQMPPQVQNRYSPSQIRKEILDGFISMKMIAREARDRGIDKDDEVRRKISYATDQLLTKQMEKELKKDIQVEESDIESYYTRHQEKYITPERIRARHILVDSEAKAQDLLEKIRSGADFAELAKKESTCPSSSKGGDLGWFSMGKMDPSFEQAAFALKKGEVSDVVKSSFGYHIIKLEDRRPSKTRTLDQARHSIQRTLENEMLQKVIEQLKEEVRSEVNVVVNEEYFKTFEKTPTAGKGEDTPAVPEKE
ncbi:MAG: peptidylprolyl isomerase [Desulfomonilia bacterium]